MGIMMIFVPNVIFMWQKMEAEHQGMNMNNMEKYKELHTFLDKHNSFKEDCDEKAKFLIQSVRLYRQLLKEDKSNGIYEFYKKEYGPTLATLNWYHQIYAQE